MMKAILVRFLVLAVALIGIAPSISLAQTPPNYPPNHPPGYLVFKGGIYSPSTDFDLGNINIDSKTGFDGEFAIGMYFAPVFAMELGGGYLESKGSPAAVPGETKLWVVPVTLTAKGLIPLGFIEPYGEFGIGAYIAKLELTGDLGDFESSTKGVFGFHAGAGVNFNITPFVFVGVEGRYLWAKPSFGGQDIKLDGFTVTADVGFRF